MKVVIASFDGRCGICDGSIRADIDEIVFVDGEWAHKECAAEDGYEVEDY